LLSNALTLADAWRFTEADVLLHALPIFHTHGLFVATNVCLASGAAMIFLPGFDADEVLRLMPRATAMMGVPTFYTRLLDEPGLTREADAHMRLFVSGSAPLLAETHAGLRGAHRPRHPRALRHDRDQHEHLQPLRRPAPARHGGLPLPGVEVIVTDPRPAPPCRRARSA
jgi:malonyl-CoA/methylmalonyl-CoA synthetase